MQILTGTVHRVLVSDGGVPKHPVAGADVRESGLEGDRQRHPEFHGGPERAVCLLGLDVIERLQGEGHPIAPGATGENLTLAGLDWSQVTLGARFRFEGGLELEAASHARPCGQIKAAFLDGATLLFDADAHPENARIYARVVVPGRIESGATLEVVLPS
jgi:MOSC domain-containing protein YiiM